MSLTTAAYLGQYQRELLAEGIDLDLAEHLVRDAAQTVAREQGITVAESCCVSPDGWPRHNHRRA